MKNTTNNDITVDIGVKSTKEFFDLFVLPTVREFEEDSNLRTLLNACYALWSMADWLYHDYKSINPDIKLADCQQLFESELPDVSLVRDIADAGKHRKLGRKTVRVERTSEITYGGSLMPLGVAPPIAVWKECNVVYDDESGSVMQRSAKELLAKVSSYWETKINEFER